MHLACLPLLPSLKGIADADGIPRICKGCLETIEFGKRRPTPLPRYGLDMNLSPCSGWPTRHGLEGNFVHHTYINGGGHPSKDGDTKASPFTTPPRSFLLARSLRESRRAPVSLIYISHPSKR